MKTPETTLLNMAKTPHPANQPGIRERLKWLIDEKYNARQGELAADAGIQPAAMSVLLNGKKPASIKQLRSIEAVSRARFEWLVSGTAPAFHALGWVPLASEPAKEGEFLRAFVDAHKSEFTQVQVGEMLGVTKSTVSDYFSTTTFDLDTRNALLGVLRTLTQNPALSEDAVFGGMGLVVSEHLAGYATARAVRQVGNLSGEPVLVLPFVPLRARAGISTPRYWEHPPETTRVLRTSLAELEPDLTSLRKNWWIIEVDGDSMEPQLVSRSRVLAWYVAKEAVADLKPGVWAIQYDDDFVIKRVRANSLEAEQGLMLHSDNPPPDPYFIRADSVRHVWFIEKTIDSKVR